MGYVAVRGGAEAIEASIERLRYERIAGGTVTSPGQVRQGMRRLVEQVMSEASLYDEDAASLAATQAEGSPEEAVFLLRAYRSTLTRTQYSLPVRSESMRVIRRISAAFKDIPGGQILGASPDYTHRLLDPRLFEEDGQKLLCWVREFLSREVPPASIGTLPKVVDLLRAEGLVAPCHAGDAPLRDITRANLVFPASRSERLQTLTRGQTGAVTALAYAALRGYGALHPTVAELRVGYLQVSVPDPSGEAAAGSAAAPGAAGAASTEEDGYYVGEVLVTEVETLIPVSLPRGQGRAELVFELGYGACFGRNETKAIAMSILEHCLETADPRYPTHDEEFVLMHVDPVEATGFISHLKLPHYVTFQSKLDAVRTSRRGDGQ
jgi:alpha-D-ribose 1-methylphosphonate 5-triphosphate synthase subunit PhnI